MLTSESHLPVWLSEKIYEDFLFVQKYIYEPNDLFCRNLLQEKESEEYGACSFELGKNIIKLRFAKITPLKRGQFVTFWKRNSFGDIVPYDMTDALDFFIVHARSGKRFGQFIFPKELLLQKGIISKDGVGGKRAIRVYPPWDQVDNKQAQKTQKWQQDYFCETDIVHSVDKVISARFKPTGNVGAQVLVSLGKQQM